MPQSFSLSDGGHLEGLGPGRIQPFQKMIVLAIWGMGSIGGR